MAGMVIGPAIGGFIALFNLGVVFGLAAALSALTVVALATLPNVRARATVAVPARALHVAWVLMPLILLGAGTSYMIGAFDTIWSLYLTYRGATTFAVCTTSPVRTSTSRACTVTPASRRTLPMTR